MLPVLILCARNTVLPAGETIFRVTNRGKYGGKQRRTHGKIYCVA